MYRLNGLIWIWGASYVAFWLASHQRRRDMQMIKHWEDEGYELINKPQSLREQRDYRYGWLAGTTVASLGMLLGSFYTGIFLGMLTWLAAWKWLGRWYRFTHIGGLNSLEMRDKLMRKKATPLVPVAERGSAKHAHAINDPDMIEIPSVPQVRR